MNNLGVFRKLSSAQGPLTAIQLGEQTGGDPLLIGICPSYTQIEYRNTLTKQLA